MFNKVEHPEELGITRQIDAGLESVLSMALDYFGFLVTDPGIRRSLNEQTVFVRRFPDGAVGKSLARIAARIVRYWTTPVKNSAQRILAEAAKILPRPDASRVPG